MEGHKLPPDLDYNAIQGLRLGGKREALRRAAHGSGTGVPNLRRQPADLTALMIWLENKR